MLPGEPCVKQPFVNRLAIEQPALLRQEPWATHLRECAACQDLHARHSRSLALYRHFEKEGLAGCPAAMSWEKMAAALDQERSRRAIRPWLRAPVFAAVSGMLLLVAVASWDLLESPEPAPAHIVTLQPQAQDRLQQVILRTLEPFEQPSAASTEAYSPVSVPVREAGAGSSEDTSAATLAAMAQLVRPLNAHSLSAFAPGSNDLVEREIRTQTHPFLERRALPFPSPALIQGGGTPLPAFNRANSGADFISFPVYDP